VIKNGWKFFGGMLCVVGVLSIFGSTSQESFLLSIIVIAFGALIIKLINTKERG